jgi:hypothetical protein
MIPETAQQVIRDCCPKIPAPGGVQPHYACCRHQCFWEGDDEDLPIVLWSIVGREPVEWRDWSLSKTLLTWLRCAPDPAWLYLLDSHYVMEVLGSEDLLWRPEQPPLQSLPYGLSIRFLLNALDLLGTEGLQIGMVLPPHAVVRLRTEAYQAVIAPVLRLRDLHHALPENESQST